MTFSALGVPSRLVDVLRHDGKEIAFPIQVDTLPDTLAGNDVLGRGKTGSGKTLAFAIPIVARLADRPSGRIAPGRPRALVLAPTRELATQINAVLEPLARAYGMTSTTIFGGVSQSRQVSALRSGVDIVVACPGRLEDLMKQRHVSLDDVEVTVLDEADHMADLGFLPGVTRIMAATPGRGQRLLFSATLDNGVDKIVARFMSNPVTHSVDDVTSHVDAMTHHIFELGGTDEKKRMIEALASGSGRRIMFMRTKHQAKKLAKTLIEAGIPAVDLHGNLSQVQRDRNLAMFGEGKALVLVATDVAARGVHVDGVELVVHVDPPAEHKAYLHRSGRTARAGSAGDVVTLVLPEQRKDTAVLMRKADIRVQPQRVTSTSDAVRVLVGALAPRLTGEAAAARVGSSGSRPQSGNGRTQSSRPQGSRPQSGSGRPQSGRSESGRPQSRSSRPENADGSRTAAGFRGRPERGGSPRNGQAPARPGSAARPVVHNFRSAPSPTRRAQG